MPAGPWRTRAPLPIPVAMTVLLAGTAWFSLAPLRTLGGAGPVEARLRLPALYLVLAPFCDTLDALSLLSIRQHLATIATMTLAFLAWRAVRSTQRPTLRGSRALRELRATGALAALVVAGYVVLTLAPRPMAAIDLRDAADLAVDFHSHTAASHDGNRSFGVRENRAWHRGAGFDAAYLSDHGTFSAATRADSGNPTRAGEGTTLLRAIEVRCAGEHLVLIGAVRRPSTSCDARDLADVDVVAILTLPGELAPARALPPVRAIELADGAPRALDQMAREGRRLRAIADSARLTMVAGSNNHGWTRTAAAWTVLTIPGWRALDPRALDAAIRRAVTNGPPTAVRVVERTRVVPPPDAVRLAATVPAAALHLLRVLTPAERIAWIAWTWMAWLLATLALRRRTVAHRAPGTPLVPPMKRKLTMTRSS